MTSASALYASSVMDNENQFCPLCTKKSFVMKSTTVKTLEVTGFDYRNVESEGEEEGTTSKPEEKQEKESEDVCK